MTESAQSVPIPGSSSPRPRSLRSVSSTSSSPLQLPSDTLALLGQFQEQREQEQERFRRLEERAEARRRAAAQEVLTRGVADLGVQASAENGDGQASPSGADDLAGSADAIAPKGDRKNKKKKKKKKAQAKSNSRDAHGALQFGVEDSMERMSVEDFRKDFGEDWQLSQFWYSAAFAEKLARLVMPLLSQTERLVFISSPTAYVGFQHAYDRANTYLFEYDRRFELIEADEFVHYDLEEPLRVPEHLKGNVGFAIVDPPFLNEATSRKVAATVKTLLAPEGRMLLLTGRSIADTACAIYKEIAGLELKETALKVEHAGGLANSFGAWASWPNAERFGSEDGA